jgi:hypothetical protein
MPFSAVLGAAGVYLKMSGMPRLVVDYRVKSALHMVLLSSGALLTIWLDNSIFILHCLIRLFGDANCAGSGLPGFH